MSSEASAALAAAADHLRASAGHVDACAEGAAYGDTPLDQPVADFTGLWSGGLLRIAEAVEQLAAYTAEAS